MHLHFLVVTLAALYGLVFPVGKLTLEYSPPLFITGARMLLAGMLLLAYEFIFHRRKFHLNRQHLWPIVMAGFTNIYLTNALEFWGLQYLNAGKACFIYSFSPIATALLSYIFWSEKITALKWLGLIIGILGFIPILVAHSDTENYSGYFIFLSYAELALFGAALSAAIGWMIMQSMVKRHGLSSVMANSTSMLVGGILAIIHSLFVEDWNPLPITEFGPFLQWFLLLTLISNIMGYNLNTYLLRHYTATFMSFAGLSQPFFAALFGWLLLGEVMTLPFWIALIAVCGGLSLYYREELKQGYIPRSQKRPQH